MKKNFILDTNVLIHDPNAIYNFGDNRVIVPIYVIEEIDKLKRAEGEKGRNARVTARLLDTLRKNGNLNTGVKLNNNGTLIVETKGSLTSLPEFLREDKVDNRILSVAKEISDNKEQTILVTKDINMRIKADALKIPVEDYETDTIKIDELYSGLSKIEVDESLFNTINKSGKIKYNEILENEPYPNEFVNILNNNKSFLTKYNYTKKRLEKLSFSFNTPWSIKARNLEQKCAFELLLDKNIQIVTLVGKAGTGKTLLALASALEQTVEQKIYKKILVARPIIPMGKDIGYLPGSEQEKLKPWMQPIFDNFDYLSETKEDKSGEKVVEALQSMGLLKIEALTYIRGRTIPKGIIIIDEAQNLTPHEIKTIVTRAGEDTKLIFTGDPYQIDNPYLDSNSNGLTYLAEKFKNVDLAGHITLIKGERSKLAEIASKLL
ncbi:PhoH-like ATPase [Hypnocyclicus thermotrophus]|uniref:PhoH-like ATPase n=1 Tax=Hypnocyclicus thermotrophus TaxID=1627895 RepID=A0AA46DY06_9FUSO|nr:PhoH family protein [Hypnocyclicus thermotrophus]TDT69191.1 PhoH-like ATPase [Hypnocyclicus thermotrophus]